MGKRWRPAHLPDNFDFAAWSLWLRARIGPRWVIARRTPGNVNRYGEGTIFLSSSRYDLLREEFLALPAVPKPLRELPPWKPHENSVEATFNDPSYQILDL